VAFIGHVASPLNTLVAARDLPNLFREKNMTSASDKAAPNYTKLNIQNFRQHPCVSKRSDPLSDEPSQDRFGGPSNLPERRFEQITVHN
jgi:hypothetical protein